MDLDDIKDDNTISIMTIWGVCATIHELVHITQIIFCLLGPEYFMHFYCYFTVLDSKT